MRRPPSHGRIGHRLRGDDRQRRVHARVVEHRLHRLLDALGVRVPEHVHGVAVRPGRRQVRFEPRHRLRRQLRERSLLRDQRVGGDDAGAAGVGHDAQPRSGREPAAPDQLGAVEDVAEVADPRDAGAPERRVVDGVFRRHGAGMGGRGPGRGGEAAGLEGDDRLLPGERARRGHEAPGVRDGFDVEDDGPRVRVLAEVVDEVAEVHVERVPDRHEVRESDPALQRPVEHRRAQRARLRDERDVTVLGECRREARVQVDARDDDAEAVGAEDPHPVEACAHLADLLLEPLAGVAGLLEARRDDDEAADPGLAAGRDLPRDLVGARADDGEIGRPRHVRQVGVAGHAEHRLVGGVHRVDHPVEAAAHQVAEDLATDAVGIRRHVDESDASGIEDAVQVLDAHAGPRASAR
jgi:hypothetical protein